MTAKKDETIKDTVTSDEGAKVDTTDVPDVTEQTLERQLAREEKTLLRQLQDMPKVKLTIPEDPNNPDDVVPVIWNGIIYSIPRGIEFDVPEVIRDIWKESYEKTQAVNKRIRESVKKEIKIL